MDEQSKTTNNSDEINLIEVIKYIWDGRWLIIKITAASLILGLVIALTSTEQFQAESRLLPEVRDTGGGASELLRQFGGGISLPAGDGADAIRPDLYPEVLKSTPFYVELLEHKIKVNTGDKYEDIKVIDYMQDHMGGFSLVGAITKYTIRLPWTVLGWFRGDKEEDLSAAEDQLFTKVPRMSEDQHEAVKSLRDRINSSIDQRTGVISVSSEFPDPVIAAQIADFAVDYLTGYITEYRVEKTQKNLEFLKKRLEDKEKEYHEAQDALSRFRDANRNVVTASLRAEEERLQHQATLAFNVYNNLAQQLEQARIKVQEETPVIKILDPVQVPMERSKPRRSLIMVISVFLGGFLGIGTVFGKKIWNNIREQLKN